MLARFDSAGMSLGALSPEAHEALATAMNRLGARSNSGEGGEDPARYRTEKNSKIKQVASGRFGVTPEYLINAEVLQIKMAQGAKPGEGGQLPGPQGQRDDRLAALRASRRRTHLAAAASRHLFDRGPGAAHFRSEADQSAGARVGEAGCRAGVGTVAAGVAKAYADLITISGHDGGTGASPLSSIKYAGTPWELGLAETHQTLRLNDLRHRVRLQTDGGLKTGLDVIKAAIIGAESFGFGTAPMVALGCKYLRICHLNNCATGIATQHDVLRAAVLLGLPEMVDELFPLRRAGSARNSGAARRASLEDLIGRTEYLQILEGQTPRQRQARSDADPVDALDSPQRSRSSARRPRNEPFDRGELAERMLRDMLPAIAANGRRQMELRGRATTIAPSAHASPARSRRRWGN